MIYFTPEDIFNYFGQNIQFAIIIASSFWILIKAISWMFSKR
jgi:hypothetical protein